eukprot:6422027-Ditylum_brightwellii.AAC.1
MKIKTPTGAIYAFYIKCKMSDTSEVATMGADKTIPINAKVDHTFMGHINKSDSRKSIKHLGMK